MNADEMTTHVVTRRGTVVHDPPLAQFLFSDIRMAWFWLILRVWLGYGWLTSGWGKFSNPAWTSGDALKGFWTGAVQVPESGRPAIAYDWYRLFLQWLLNIEAYTWFAKVVMVGEVTVGILLILGALTGIAAFVGGFMNWNFIMAGSASTNGMMMLVAMLLILAWKVAGYYGLDHWLLPLLGTPWPNDELAPAPERAP